MNINMKVLPLDLKKKFFLKKKIFIKHLLSNFTYQVSRGNTCINGLTDREPMGLNCSTIRYWQRKSEGRKKKKKKKTKKKKIKILK